MNTIGHDAGTPAGWPDVQTLERLANDIFNALPNSARDVPGPTSLSSGVEEAPAAVPLQNAPNVAPIGLSAGRGHSMPIPAVGAGTPHPATVSSVPAAVPGLGNGSNFGHPGAESPASLAQTGDIVPPGVTGAPASLSHAPEIPAQSFVARDYSHGIDQHRLPGSQQPTQSPYHAPSTQPAGPGVPGASMALPHNPGIFGFTGFDYPGDGTILGMLPLPIPASIAPPQIAGIAITGPAFYFLDPNPAQPGPASSSLRPEFEYLSSAVPGLPAAHQGALDIPRIRKDFPILSEQVNGRPLVWLDNAATTQKPRLVIDRLTHFYEHENSNIHRAAHELAARATDAYEGAREKVRVFLNAASANEIVFVRGATEGINLIAQSWGRQHIGQDDEIVIGWLEHHANIVPWQQLAASTGARLRVIPVDDDGQIILSELAKLLGPKTKLVSIAHVSNALGTIVPVSTVAAMAHAVGAKVLIDGAQAVSHMRVNVQELDADWYVFSGHKVFGPTGIGVIYGKEGLLNDTSPWQGGGNMIADVTFERTTYHKAPARFEAGTGNIADAVGLGAAIDYVMRIGMDLIGQYEHQLLLYATRLLKEIPKLRLIGTAPDKASVLSFVIDGLTTAEIGAALSREGIAVRSGHHCAQPILRRFGVESTVRPSLAFYNNCADIDSLIAALWRLRTP